MRYSLGIAFKFLIATCGGWFVNQIPEIGRLPLDIPGWVLLVFVFLVFVLLLFLEQIISENIFREQTKLVRQAIYSILVSFLFSAGLFALSINTPGPYEFVIAMQYSALFIFMLGLVFTGVSLKRFADDNPEETHDSLEESFLKAKSFAEISSQSVIRNIQELSGTRIFQDLLQGSTERQENLSIKISELKSRFLYRNQAVKFLDRIVKDKKVSFEVSSSVFSDNFGSDVNETDSRSKQERFRAQINFALKIVSVSVKFARPNAFHKMLDQTPVLESLVLGKNEYVAAFQLAYSKIEEIAIIEGIPPGAIAQIKKRFQDLIRIFADVTAII